MSAVAAVVSGCATYPSSGPPVTAPPGDSAPTAAPSTGPTSAPSTGPAGSADPGEGQSASAGPPGTALGPASAVPVGGGVIFADQSVVVTQPAEGTFRAFSAVCTHQGCTVNSVSGGTINCPCHGSKFTIADGSVATGPARRPLPPKQVNSVGGQLVVS